MATLWLVFPAAWAGGWGAKGPFVIQITSSPRAGQRAPALKIGPLVLPAPRAPRHPHRGSPADFGISPATGG